MDRSNYQEERQALLENTSKTDLWMMCRQSGAFFIYFFVEILSSEEETWIPFILWPYQVELLDDLEEHKRVILLKARQLGFTTIILAYLLWRMIFHPVATVGLFSRGELEAMELLDRLVKTYGRLPKWMKTERIIANNAHLFELSNGSFARALSTRKGESFTFRYLFLDELDRFENAEQLIKNVKPAADAANAQIIAGSISDKDRMNTVFKNMFGAAMRGENEWLHIFLSWAVRPDRDQDWYERIVDDAISRAGGDVAGAMDEVNQQYPTTPEDALSPRMQGKRIPYVHLQRVFVPLKTIQEHGGPAIPGLKVYVEPEPGGEYVVSADPAEGVPGGSDSALSIMDKKTGEQVAALQGKHEPKKVFPKMLFDLAVWYNMAGILPERNNHGHAVIGELNELIAKDYATRLAAATAAHGKLDAEDQALMGPIVASDVGRVFIYLDPADRKEGWLTSPSGAGMTRGKVLMYDNGAQQIKDMQVVLHDEVTVEQLASIDVNKLRNPDGKDDASDALVLNCSARLLRGRTLKGKLFF